MFADHRFQFRRPVVFCEPCKEANDRCRCIPPRGVRVTTLADRRVDVVGVGWMELVRVEVTCCRDDDARRASDIAVARFGVVFLVCDGEEDLGNGPLAVDFG